MGYPLFSLLSIESFTVKKRDTNIPKNIPERVTIIKKGTSV